MNVAQYAANWLATVSPRVYGVCGSHAMYLNDAICNHPEITFTATHHEQAATFAAEADARISGLPGIVHVTAGPGVTNTVTGLATAFVDSIPLIVIAGQVKRSTLAKGDIVEGSRRHGVRSYGISELPSVEIVRPITKYAATVHEPAMIRYHLEMAYAKATSGRPGPVFVEIPLDVQNAEINVENFAPIDERANNLRQVVRLNDKDIDRCIQMIGQAKRPILIIGNGIRLSGAVDKLDALVYTLGMPVISGFSGNDLFDNNHPKYIGRCGLHGDRASNFAVQNADLILAVGTRLSLPQIGHDPKLFAPNAYKIVVDIDYMEATKEGLSVDLPIAADARDFMRAVIRRAPTVGPFEDWLAQCQAWRGQYPVDEETWQGIGGVNPYAFINELTKHLDDDAIIVTDVGFSFLTPFQAMKLNGRQRLIFASGVGPMGWGLPAAIGACRAGGGRQVVLIAGDGGMMFNLQELQTIAHHKLPIAIFVFENGAYKTMQITQEGHFKREAAAGERSGVSCPEFVAVAKTFGIPGKPWPIEAVDDLEYWIKDALADKLNLTVVEVDPSAILAPRVATRTDNGKFLPSELADMWPYLDREEYERNMLVGAQKRSDAA